MSYVPSNVAALSIRPVVPQKSSSAKVKTIDASSIATVELEMQSKERRKVCKSVHKIGDWSPGKSGGAGGGSRGGETLHCGVEVAGSASIVISSAMPQARCVLVDPKVAPRVGHVRKGAVSCGNSSKAYQLAQPLQYKYQRATWLGLMLRWGLAHDRLEPKWPRKMSGFPLIYLNFENLRKYNVGGKDDHMVLAINSNLLFDSND